MKVVDAYLAAFKKTPLVMLINGQECTTYATQHGTGWRADSLGDLGSFSPTWNHMRDAYPKWIRETRAEEAWKNGPVAYEPPLDVAEFVEKGWPLRWIFNYALACTAATSAASRADCPTGENVSARTGAVSAAAGLPAGAQGTEASRPGQAGRQDRSWR